MLGLDLLRITMKNQVVEDSTLISCDIGAKTAFEPEVPGSIEQKAGTFQICTFRVSLAVILVRFPCSLARSL